MVTIEVENDFHLPHKIDFLFMDYEVDEMVLLETFIFPLFYQ